MRRSRHSNALSSPIQRTATTAPAQGTEPADETAQREMIAAIEKDIERPLDGFDARLEAVNRRLDHVLERRA